MFIIYHFVFRMIVKFMFRVVNIHSTCSNVIMEFAQGIVYVEDDQRLYGKREIRFNV